jgi:putative protease
MSEEKLKEVGTITHYFPKIGVAIVEVTAPIAVGDTIRIKGTTTDFEQTVKSMEIEHKKIEKAKPGDSIGLKVEDKVRERDIVYKKTE